MTGPCGAGNTRRAAEARGESIQARQWTTQDVIQATGSAFSDTMRVLMGRPVAPGPEGDSTTPVGHVARRPLAMEPAPVPTSTVVERRVPKVVHRALRLVLRGERWDRYCLWRAGVAR